MSNSRYSRRADHARGKLVMATGFAQAIAALQCGLVVSAISEKFRQEMGYGQKYTVWVRLAGWDERHFYVEHVFLMEKGQGKEQQQGASSSCCTAKRQTEDERIRQQVTFDGTAETVQQVVDLQTRNFHQATAAPTTTTMPTNFIVASILTIRMTTTRTKSTGSIVTPSQVLHQMGLRDVLPSLAPPPADVQEWTKSVEVNSDRFTKKTQQQQRLRSKL
mmetsp:Transcript_26813/g.44690  ORF Transcript_26813/g.44690 Transcript_26813/m.44690 type:complete len:219 (-) Transcript_26813:17-673(-)